MQQTTDQRFRQTSTAFCQCSNLHSRQENTNCGYYQVFRCWYCKVSSEGCQASGAMYGRSERSQNSTNTTLKKCTEKEHSSTQHKATWQTGSQRVQLAIPRGPQLYYKRFSRCTQISGLLGCTTYKQDYIHVYNFLI
jgi:hypothetical protein